MASRPASFKFYAEGALVNMMISLVCLADG